MSDEDYMRRAIALSKTALDQPTGGPFGAVIVKDGRIVAEGTNEVTAVNDPTAHAEIVAIRRACGDLKTFSLASCTIYTSCEPCPMCLSAIHWARLDKLYFAANRHEAAAAGFDDELLYRLLNSANKQPMLPMARLLSDEAASVLTAWIAKPDKIPY
ncbi:MAG: nucleoside deaminase [Alphaproteobacteria bacterium]